MPQNEKDPRGRHPGGPSECGLLGSDQAEDKPRARANQAGRYPQTPGFKDDGAGRDAARAYTGQARTRRQQVLAAIGETPTTAEQIGERIGVHWYLVRPRLSELKLMGEVVKAPGRGPSALGGSATLWRRTTPEERAAFAVRSAA